MVSGFFVRALIVLNLAYRDVTGATFSPTPAQTIFSSEVTPSGSPSPAPSLAVHPDYPDCETPAMYISDGYCNTMSNTASCGWDGGDCCECTCASTSGLECGSSGYRCEDPEATRFFQGKGCQNVSVEAPQVEPCSQEIRVDWIVEKPADATALAKASLCSGGYFDVEWKGHVDVSKTIYALNGTFIRITGVSDAVADGGGTLQIFFLYGGVLNLANVDIVNGASYNGGAIIAAANSELYARGVVFRSNTAEKTGGAVYAVSSTVNMVSSSFNNNSANDAGAIVVIAASELFAEAVVFSSNTAQNIGGAVYAVASIADLVSTTFAGNSADYGGALFVLNSTIIGNGSSTFTGNTAYVNGGALCITDISRVGWNSGGGYSSHSLSSSNSYDIGDGWIAGEAVFMNNSAEGLGGAIFAENCYLFWSGTTSLELNRARYGGALYLENDVTIQTGSATVFASNYAVFDGGAVTGANDGGGKLYVNGSTSFTNNSSGGNGGAIELTNIDLIVNGNLSFSRNSAVSFGGALYASQVDAGPILTGVTFFKNSAESGGAVFFSAVGTNQSGSFDADEMVLSSASKFIGCNFDGNSASSTGGAIHSTAGRDVVNETTFTRNSAVVGGAIRVSGTVYLISSSFVDNTSGEGEGPAVSNSGVILEMVGLYFSGNGYRCSSDAFVGFNEVIDGRYGVVCDGCDLEYQDYTIKDRHFIPVCEELLDHTHSQDGAATLETLVLDAGYWRATNTSRNILECFNKDACGGGQTWDPEYCSTGYDGPFCALCTEGYAGTMMSHHCRNCAEEDFVGPILFIIVGGLLALLFLRYMVSIEEDRTSWGSVDRLKGVVPLQSFKIIIVSWQIVTQFSTVATVVYPSLYQELLEGVALLNFDFSWILSMACIVDVDFHTELIITTISPLAVVAVLGLTYAVALRRNHGSQRALRIVRRKHANAVIVVAFLIYSSVSSAVFRAFACDSLDDGNVYLRADCRIQCNTPKHMAFQIYAGLMIAVYPVGIPVLFAVLLFRDRKVLKSATLRKYDGEFAQQSTSSLWKPYKPSVFYYEVVECGRRLMLAGVVVFIYPNTAAQIAVTLAIAFIFAFASERLDPYDSRWDGRVSRMGHIMVVLTMYVALLTKVDISSEGNQSQNMFAVILVTAHIAMVLTAVTEAITMIRSIRENDSPLPKCRSGPGLPVDTFPGLQNNSADMEFDH